MKKAIAMYEDSERRSPRRKGVETVWESGSVSGGWLTEMMSKVSEIYSMESTIF